MKRIWKFPIPASGKVTMPVGAKVLTVQTQQETICLWALVDEIAAQSAPETRMFRTAGTGWELPDNPGKYIGSVQLQDGALVFHVFEGPRE